MTDTYRVGVVGCGSIATERHIPAIEANDRTTLRAVYDHKWSNAETTAETYDVPYAYDDYDALLDSGIDFVTVATPPFAHADRTTAALRAGVDVLCEKPMAVTLSDAQSMIDAADESGRTLGIVHNFLYSNSLRKVDRMAANGTLGTVRYAKGFQLSSPRRDLPSWYTDLPGGLFFDESPHLLYLMERFVGTLDLESSTAQRAPADAQSLKSVTATFRGREDKVGQLTMIFDAPLSEWFLFVVGTRRLVVVDIFRDILLTFDREDSHSPLQVLKVLLSGTGQAVAGALSSGLDVLRGDLYFGFGELLSRYTAALDSNGEPPVTGADGYRILRTVHDVVESTEETD